MLAPLTLIGANTIGNVPLVVLLLSVLRRLGEGAFYALAVLSTLAGNLLLIGSLANIIAVERAAEAGVRLSFVEHARCGVPMTLLSLLFAFGWLWLLRHARPEVRAASRRGPVALLFGQAIKQGVGDMATLIKGGRIVTAEGEFPGDILIENGKVRMLGQGLPAPAGAEVHDASGLLVMPGAVDVHTHLDWEFGSARTVDTFGTGTMAAAFGGTTSVIDFANQSHGQSPLAGLEDWHRRCASRCVDVGAHMIILDPFPQALADLRTLARDEGVTSFKLFMAYPNVLMVDDGVCFYVMREAAKHGAVVCVHAENGYAINVLVSEAVAGGQSRAQIPLSDPPARARGRGDPARDHARRIRRRPPLRRPRHLQPGARRGRRGQGPLRPDPRRDLHPVSLSHEPGTGAARASRAPNTSSRRRCAARSIRTSSGAASPAATCPWSRPTTARSASTSSPTA